MMPTPPPNRAPTHPVTVPPYTRADAITDGLLIEVPQKLTRMFRFTCPVAVTQLAWHDAVAWDPHIEAGKPRPTGQSESARITEVLWAARQALYTNRTGGQDIRFLIHRVPPHGPQTHALRCNLVLHLHCGDHGETVATIAAAQVPMAGQFYLADDPATVWVATGFDTDTSGRLSPVVTADTLDEILAAATDITDISNIEVTSGSDGSVHVHEPSGLTHTLRPDQHGRYHLRPLDWPLVCRPSDR